MLSPTAYIIGVVTFTRLNPGSTELVITVKFSVDCVTLSIDVFKVTVALGASLGKLNTQLKTFSPIPDSFSTPSTSQENQLVSGEELLNVKLAASSQLEFPSIT